MGIFFLKVSRESKLRKISQAVSFKTKQNSKEGSALHCAAPNDFMHLPQDIGRMPIKHYWNNSTPERLMV